MPDEFDDEETEPDEVEADDDLVLDDDDDDLDDDLVVDDADAEVVDVDAPADPAVPVAAAGTDEETEEDDENLDLEEELHPDDVEEPLDVLLQERTASATLEDDEEDLDEDEGDADDRVDGPTRIVPRRPGEFLCKSCFLVLPRNQLADEAKELCRDCA